MKKIKKNKENITWAINYALSNVNTNESGIYFNDPNDLTRFLTSMQFGIPKSYWRANTLYIESSTVLDEWRTAYHGMRTLKAAKSSKKGRSGHGAVRLELIHPDEKSIKEKGNFKKYSSNLLIYTFRMIAIMIANRLDEE